MQTVLTLRSQVAVRLPSPGYRPEFGDVDTARVDDVLATLRRDGIAVLPGYFAGPDLERALDAFERVIGDEPVSEEVPDSYLSTDFLHHDPSFVDLALDPFLLRVIGGYYRRPFYLGRATAQRLLPTSGERYGSFQWHHDTRARQLKLMVLLADLDDDGQCMHYRRGTQRRFYSYDRMYGPGSRFEDDHASRAVDEREITKVSGPAGTAALFDTNGLHSGNRNGRGGRDTVIFDYTTGYNTRPLRYRREDVDGLRPELRALVTRNPKHVLV